MATAISSHPLFQSSLIVYPQVGAIGNAHRSRADNGCARTSGRSDRREAARMECERATRSSGRALPGRAVGGDELQGVGVRAGRNPGKARHHARLLRRHDLELMRAIPVAKIVGEARADATVAVEDYRVGTSDGPSDSQTVVGGAALGCCCVRQCSVPNPHTRSTAWMPTTCRFGMSRASALSAMRSLGSLKVGTRTTPLAM